jgi:shikimate dehydrogenase
VAGSRSHELVESADAVFDVVYDPWPTRLLDAAHETGRPAVSGIDLLAHQAVLQLALMTGSTVDVDVLRDAALVALSTTHDVP